MKENHTHFEQFEALLKQKSFDDLSETEKDIVSAFCDSSQEYGLMRKMILTPPLTDTPTAEFSVPQSLLDKVSGNAKPSGLQRLLNLKIPMWLYLLSMCTVFGLTYFLRPAQIEIKETIKEVPKEIIKEVPKEIIKTDTVVQYAYRIDTVYLSPKKSAIVMHPQNPKKPNATLVNQKNKEAKSTKIEHNEHPKGRTIKQDPDLKAFFTDML